MENKPSQSKAPSRSTTDIVRSWHRCSEKPVSAILGVEQSDMHPCLAEFLSMLESDGRCPCPSIHNAGEDYTNLEMKWIGKDGKPLAMCIIRSDVIMLSSGMHYSAALTVWHGTPPKMGRMIAEALLALTVPDVDAAPAAGSSTPHDRT